MSAPEAMRHAFRMRLKPGAEEEYRRRHDTIWPELTQSHTDAGIFDYSIYYDPATRYLFAFQRLDPGHKADRLSDLEVVHRWWHHLEDLMDTNPDGSPVVAPLREVFYLA
jgi:L-rhamnose mutarotase